MKQLDPRSNSDTTTARLPEVQWQQYAEAASRFAAEWAHEMDEKGEAHSFWDEFLQFFNIRRRQFARHEARAGYRQGKGEFKAVRMKEKKLAAFLVKLHKLTDFLLSLIPIFIKKRKLFQNNINFASNC